MNSYFHNIVNGVQTLFEGMSITLASMFVRPVTVQYPEVDISSNETISRNYKSTLMGMPEIYRGILDVDLTRCTACQLCMKACPIDCIVIENVKCDKIKLVDKSGESIKNRFTQKESVKTRTCIRFDINAGKCMYCGLCANACSTRAIFHTKRFEMNKFNLDDLVMRFVSDSERDQAKSRAKEIEAEALAKKAAKKKAKQAELDKTSKNGGDNK